MCTLHPHVKTLVLNSDLTPLHTVSWQDAFTRLFKETPCNQCEDGTNGIDDQPCANCDGKLVVPNATVINNYPLFVRDGAGKKHFLPSVIKNSNLVKRMFRKIPFSRLNIFRRDDFTCQYCCKRFPAKELELEHVIPRSRYDKSKGTPTHWENIVSACTACNRFKNDSLLKDIEMKLCRVDGNGNKVYYDKPEIPNYASFTLGMSPYDEHLPEDWKEYLICLGK